MSADLLISLALAVVLLCWAVGAHNRLVRLKNAVGREYAPIDAQLVLRQELLAPWLSAAPHLEPALAQALEMALRTLRSALEQARQWPSGEAQMLALQHAEQQLDHSLATLWALPAAHQAAEREPALRQSVCDWVALQDKLVHVAEPHRGAVQAFNDAVAEFPAWLIARLAGLRPLSGLDLGSVRAARDAARPMMRGRREDEAPGSAA